MIEVEVRNVQVAIITMCGRIDGNIMSKDTFQAVLTLAQEKTSKSDLELFYQKKQVRKEDVLGLVCEENVCEIHAGRTS